jgi:O-antigen/teichoic acid export membrane protein
LSKYLKNLSFYSFGEFLSKSIQFLLLPVYAHYLLPADYGKLELTYLYGAVLVIFYGFIIENGYGRLYFDSKESTFRDKLFGTAIFFKLSVGVFFLAISLLFSQAIASWLFDFSQGAEYLRLISLSVFIKSLAEIPLKTLVNEKRATRYVINNLIYLVVSITSTIFFVVVLRLNIVGVLYGQILGASVQLLTLLVSEWKPGFFGFSFSSLKSMLLFSLFLIPSQLASFVTFWSNRLFLSKFANLEDLGTFSFGYKIASVIPILLTQPIKKVSGPEIYELIDRPEECRRRIRQLTLVMIIFLSLFSLALSILSKELIMIMAAKSFSSSHEVVYVLSMSYVLIGVAGIVVTAIQISKKTWLITITWAASALINVLTNLWMVPRFGKVGATYATLMTMCFILVMYFLFAEIVYRVRFEYGKYVSIAGLTSLIHFAASRISSGLLALDVMLKGIVLLVTTFLFLRVFINSQDRGHLQRFVAKKVPFVGRLAARLL